MARRDKDSGFASLCCTYLKSFLAKITWKLNMRNRDIIFKGATRPAMMLGVPIVPLILVAGIDILLAMWSLVLVSTFGAFVILAAGLMVIFVLRYISSQDDQRLS